MVRIIDFLYSRKNTILFLLLELFSLILILKTHDYAETKTSGFALEISGVVHSRLNYFSDYLKLRQTNQELMQQNAILLNQVHNPSQLVERSIAFNNQFDFVPAHVVSNQYQFQNNYIILNRGSDDGIEADMGVVGTQGIIGIIAKTSKHYSGVISILNGQSKINVNLKGTNFNGFLEWTGTNPNLFEVLDLPINAPLKTGDTVTTSGVSNIFPKGIACGTIQNIETVSGRKTYKLIVKPLIDMTNLGAVYVVKNPYKKEFDSLSVSQ